MNRPSSPTRLRPAAASTAAFTLVEICVAIFIVVIILGIALPSVSGVLAERRLRASVDALGDLAATAQRRSVTEGKTFLLAWDGEGRVRLCPEDLPVKARREVPPAALPPGGQYELELPAALATGARAAPGNRANPAGSAGEWAFWPSGNCEPAVVRFSGTAGSWEAVFNPLTARANLSRFQPR